MEGFATFAVVEKYNLGISCQLDIDIIHNAVKSMAQQAQLPIIKVDSLYDLSWEAQADKLVKLYSNLIKEG